jgi:hypothetical protein
MSTTHKADAALFRDMEQALIVEFSKMIDARVRSSHEAGAHHPYVVGSALCGQDQALADYLFAARGQFALIEFKASEERLKTEGTKEQRLRLLDSCAADSARLARAQTIHHAAWGRPVQLDLPGLGRQTMEEIVVARYVAKVGAVLGRGLPKAVAREWRAAEFIDAFIERRTTGSNIQRFKRYLTELYELVGTDGASGLAGFQGMVTVYVPGAPQPFQSLRFDDFTHLMKLTIHYDPQYLREHEQSRAMHRDAPEHRPTPSRDPGMSR